MSIEQTTERYAVIGTNVHDRQADRIARFQNAGVAQIGADWLNGPDATPEDYEWISAADMTSEEWLQTHPEAIAASPAWADIITAEDEQVAERPAVSIGYDRKFDSLEIGTAATWRDGTVDFHGDNRPYIYFWHNERPVTAADLRAFAADFLAAAEALEAA